MLFDTQRNLAYCTPDTTMCSESPDFQYAPAMIADNSTIACHSQINNLDTKGRLRALTKTSVGKQRQRNHSESCVSVNLRQNIDVNPKGQPLCCLLSNPNGNHYATKLHVAEQTRTDGRSDTFILTCQHIILEMIYFQVHLRVLKGRNLPTIQLFS